MWRLQDGVDGQQAQAVLHALSLSYHDAGRWLDAQETVENVENVPASPEVVGCAPAASRPPACPLARPSLPGTLCKPNSAATWSWSSTT
jgi:hypothetical protein